MKAYLISIFCVFSISAFCQTFDGVMLRGDYGAIMKSLIKKEYVAVQPLDSGIVMLGYWDKQRVEVFLIQNPKTKRIHRAEIYMSARDTWADLMQDFRKFETLVMLQFGEPDVVFRLIPPPYSMVSGNVIDAVRNGKVNFSNQWHHSHTSSFLSIDKYTNVGLVYEFR